MLKRKFLAMLTAGEEGENSITIEKMARDILEFIWPNFNVVEYMFADKTESGERFKDISIYMFKNIEKKVFFRKYCSKCIPQCALPFQGVFS